MITVIPGGYSYTSDDMDRLRTYLELSNGCISSALRVLESDGAFQNCTPAMMVEIVRLAEKTLRDPRIRVSK